MRSMFGILGVIITAAFLYGAYVSSGDAPVATSDDPSYQHERYGISFMRPPGYGVSESLDGGSALREHLAIALKDAAETTASSSIMIDIYQNSLDRLSTLDWITNTAQSRFKSSDGVLASTTIDGKEALMYRWDDGVTGTSIVRAETDWIYVFSVTYGTPQDRVVTDFAMLIQTVDIGR